MNICLTTDTIHRGGKERQLFLIAKALIKSNHNVHILTESITTDSYYTEYSIDKDIIIEFSGPNIFKKYQNFKGSINVEKPDVIIAWDFQTAFFSLLLYKDLNIKFINASIRHGIRLFKLKHFLRSIVCYFSPYLLANSYAGLKANNIKISPNRFVLHNGTESKFFNSYSHSEIEYLRTILLPVYSERPATIYITVANFVPYKDFFTVIKSFRKLIKIKEFYYIIIGDGPTRGKIETKIKEFGLENNIYIIGKTENVRDYLFISDIMIHSSRGEGISNAILEGMFAGLPIIATNVGGIPETVYPGSSMLFPYKDDKALFKCLLEASDVFTSFDKESKDYKNHLERFTVDCMVKRFEEIIKEVM